MLEMKFGKAINTVKDAKQEQTVEVYSMRDFLK